MNEQDVQIIGKDGEPEYAVVPIEEYRRVVAALEDAADSASIERAWAEDAAGETIPGEVVKGHSRWRTEVDLKSGTFGTSLM